MWGKSQNIAFYGWKTAQNKTKSTNGNHIMQECLSCQVLFMCNKICHFQMCRFQFPGINEFEGEGGVLSYLLSSIQTRGESVSLSEHCHRISSETTDSPRPDKTIFVVFDANWQYFSLNGKTNGQTGNRANHCQRVLFSEVCSGFFVRQSCSQASCNNGKN